MNGPGPYSCFRLYEWHAAAAMLGFGLWSLAFPGAIAASRFSSVLLILSGPQTATLALTIGLARFLVLYGNGGLGKWGPGSRTILSVMSAVIWAQFAVALIATNPSPGIPVYLSFTVFEIITVWRAMRDLHGLTARR